MKHKDFYNRITHEYDSMIDWKARLSKELPFFIEFFEKYKVESIIDLGCSGGNHAIAFTKAGYRVTGCDISPNMIVLARENARQAGVEVEFIQTGLTELTDNIKEQVEAITCLGNTLPHLHTEQEITDLFGQAHRLLKPGGIIILQILNYTREIKEQRRTRPIKQGMLNGKEFFFLRIFDYLPDDFIQGNFIILERSGTDWNIKVSTLILKAIYKNDLEKILINTGFEIIDYFGNYKKSPFGSDSPDLIVVARRKTMIRNFLSNE